MAMFTESPASVFLVDVQEPAGVNFSDIKSFLEGSDLRTRKSFIVVILCAGLLFQILFPSRACAALLAADDASQPAYSDGWQQTDNGGTGFGPWMLTQSATTGFLIG